MNIYCITHKPLKNIEKLGLLPTGVGKNNFPSNYIIENFGENIAHKNQYYSETSFHYWIWKNLLPYKKDNEWFGTCQYRRYFVKKDYENLIQNSKGKQGYLNLNSIEELKNILQTEPSKEWNEYEVILCNPWSVEVLNKMKLIKRGFKSIIRDPSIIYNKKKHSIKLHFDMFHGHGNLDKAIQALPLKDRKDFIDFVSNKTWLSGHCIYFSNNSELLNRFYKDLFGWLFECEKIFGFDTLIGYDTQRIYSFLTERYMPFWFQKYSKILTWPWVYCDITKF